ncbi:MAG: hypothetical protein HND57_16735 [Planctomycetes bacterium]|nr:hypothetical protein [Planctomycetota bacterium]
MISRDDQLDRLRRDPAVLDLVARLRGEFDPCSIYLFGSRAGGSSHASSDFDAIVVVGQ